MDGLGHNYILVIKKRYGLLNIDCVFFEYTTKQTVKAHQNKRFHQPAVSAEGEQSETFLGRG